MKATPYNTGKVLIGIHYQPIAKPGTPSRTELTLQAALLQIKPASLIKRVLNRFWSWA